MNKHNSPYSSAVTGCGFMFYEFNRVLPLLTEPNQEELTKKEVSENNLLLISSEVSRKKVMREFVKRFNTLPVEFWEHYQTLSETAQRLAWFYCMLKTYRIMLDFHIKVAIPKWNSVEQTIEKSDVMQQFYEIAAVDEFVDSWSDETKNRVATVYLTSLRQTGLLEDKTDRLRQLELDDSDYLYYLTINEPWFLECCLLRPYEIERIKNSER